MRTAVFSTKPYDRDFLDRANQDFGYELVYFESRLSTETADLARGFPTVCLFVNDLADRTVLQRLHDGGTTLVALRAAGFNNVDLKAAAELAIPVVRVPAYSPYAVAEHTVALMLSLNRNIHRAWSRTRENNFSLQGLLGYDLHGKKVGIIGTGRIGTRVAHILAGMGCELLGYDVQPSAECQQLGLRYVDLDTLLRSARVVTLHCPLTPETHYLIDAARLAKMQRGVMLINTSRGAVIDTGAVVEALKAGQLGYLGIDVYEQEADLFFEDLSEQLVQDDIFQRLLTFPNVLITGHQGFFTHEALEAIAHTTLQNIRCIAEGGVCDNAIPPPPVSSTVGSRA